MLKKKGKDKRLIKNWRPISLINVDAKIASKTLAKRLEPILPELIQCGQNAYVKGRTIFDAVRTIDDILDYTRYKKMSGILVAIDFEKAFDSLDHTYLFKVLNAFNFGPSFIRWIRVLYSNISSCIINRQWFYIKLFCSWSRCATRRPTLTSSFHIRIRNSGLQYSKK